MKKARYKSVVNNKLVSFGMLKQIVTFYYNILFNYSKILKKSENVSINILEHKNCLSLLKASVYSNY